MGKNSKQHNNALVKLTEKLKNFRQKAQHFEPGVIEAVAREIDRLSTGKLPDTVAILPSDVLEPSELYYVLRFDSFNSRVCEYAQIDATKMNGLLDKFCLITQTTPNTIAQTHIVRDTVNNVNPYTSLFSALSPDVDRLDETEISGGGRMFFYRRGNLFYIVSIETKHRNIY